MARGYCPECGELVPIAEGEAIDPKFSARRWYPLPHPKPGVLFSECPGTKKAI